MKMHMKVEIYMVNGDWDGDAGGGGWFRLLHVVALSLSPWTFISLKTRGERRYMIIHRDARARGKSRNLKG